MVADPAAKLTINLDYMWKTWVRVLVRVQLQLHLYKHERVYITARGQV